MIQCAFTWLLALLLTGQICAAEARGIFAEGRAFDMENDTLLYTEQHIRLTDAQHTVLYRDGQGRLFAEKRLDFTHSRIAPEVIQQDRRTGELISVSRQPEGKTLKVIYRQDSDLDTQYATLPLNSQRVIDAGFDHFVRSRRSEIETMGPISFQYLLTSRQKDIRLQVERADCRESDNTCFTITPAAWLYRMLASAIHLEYDNDSGCLVRFRGKSNISDASGRFRPMEIHYTHSDSCPRAEHQKAVTQK